MLQCFYLACLALAASLPASQSRPSLTPSPLCALHAWAQRKGWVIGKAPDLSPRPPPPSSARQITLLTPNSPHLAPPQAWPWSYP
jgi:hypothetical protein